MKTLSWVPAHRDGKPIWLRRLLSLSVSVKRPPFPDDPHAYMRPLPKATPYHGPLVPHANFGNHAQWLKCSSVALGFRFWRYRGHGGPALPSTLAAVPSFSRRQIPSIPFGRRNRPHMIPTLPCAVKRGLAEALRIAAA